MLSEEKVEKNARKFFSVGKKNGFMTDELELALGVDFITAPASTNTDLFCAYEGGLIEHIFSVTKYALGLKSIIPIEVGDISDESLIKVCYLHQIGKTKLFKPINSSWHNQRGIMYEYNHDLVSMRVGERSIFMSLNNGLTFTEDEYQAIINHDKDDSDKQAKWHTNLLGVILKLANELAVLEHKNVKNV